MRNLFSVIGVLLISGLVAAACGNQTSSKPIVVIRDAEAVQDGGGTVALAMILAYHGRNVGLDELRPLVAVDEGGSNALAIVEAAKRYGLSGRGIKLELRDIDVVPRPSILHWRGDYFVVYDGHSGDVFRVIHPVDGVQVLGVSEFSRQFTGVALLFESD